MKAVFDRNIFISAFTFPGGNAGAAVLAALEGRVELFISKPIIHEVLYILSRKFDCNAEELARAGVFLSELAMPVQPRGRISVLKDEPDNRILECALAAHAEVIVTGDKAMLELHQYKDIRIVALNEFLGLL